MLTKLRLLVSCVVVSGLAQAWDYEGHRMVNQVALASLPAGFPGFVKEPANAERIAFLAGEPDRWRNVPDLPLKQSGGSWTDHFCDLEYLTEAGLDLATLTSFRYDFLMQYAAGRSAHPDHFPPIDPAKNADHTREWPGFAPWAITEYFGRLRSACSYLKVFQELGTREEIANAEANIAYLMGIMGHYVGDCAQPLHTTKHHNGWVGPNPKGYTTWPGLHSWVDGGFVAKAGIKFATISGRIVPAVPISLAARADGRDPMFVAVLDYLRAQHQLVEPLYQLEKAGKLGHGEQPITDEARALIEGQLLKGGVMLGSIWLTAWTHTTPDTYLRAALIKRTSAAGGTAGNESPAKEPRKKSK
jgi:hypothetical protein